jgi:hypothetical protein
MAGALISNRIMLKSARDTWRDGIENVRKLRGLGGGGGRGGEGVAEMIVSENADD